MSPQAKGWIKTKQMGLLSNYKASIQQRRHQQNENLSNGKRYLQIIFSKYPKYIKNSYSSKTKTQIVRLKNN